MITYLQYALSLLEEHSPQTTCLHPAASFAFLQLLGVWCRNFFLHIDLFPRSRCPLTLCYCSVLCSHHSALPDMPMMKHCLAVWGFEVRDSSQPSHISIVAFHAKFHSSISNDVNATYTLPERLETMSPNASHPFWQYISLCCWYHCTSVTSWLRLWTSIPCIVAWVWEASD